MKKLLGITMLLSVLFVSDFLFVSDVQAQNAPCSDCGNVVISAIVNGRTSGRRGIQICAINDVADLSKYHLITDQSNLSDSEFVGYNRDGSPQGSVTGFSGSLLAGECIWLVDNFFNITDDNNFLHFMEGTVDISEVVDGTFNIDDDWNILLLCGGNIDDIYGTYIAALDEDGDFMTNATDEIAEDDPAYYEDTWVLSNNDRCPNGGTMDIANWLVGPIDDLDEYPDPDGGAFGEDVDFISQSSFPGASYTNTSTCSNVRTCGGLQLCKEIRYECVENENSLDDFLMKIDYIGMEPGLTLGLLEEYDCNITYDVSSDDPATTPDGTIVLLNKLNDGCGASSTLWGIEFISSGCDGVQVWNRVPEDCILECSNGVQDGDEEGIDCGGSCPNPCGDPPAEPTCTDGIQNGDEEGVDCGGSCANACTDPAEPTCSDGIQNGDEEGVDCGGSCANACTDPAEPTCTDGIQNGDEEGIDCGGSCADACTTAPTCSDGIQNGDEEGIDCGGSCADACTTAPTCNDGIQNGDETGVDCGGSCPNTCGDLVTVPTMSEWGLIILSLLLLNFVFINVIVGKLSVQGFNNQTINLFNWRNLNSYPFNETLFRKAINYTIAILVLIAIFAIVVYGFFTLTDVVGLAIASPIFAYLLHLFFMANKATSNNS